MDKITRKLRASPLKPDRGTELFVDRDWMWIYSDGQESSESNQLLGVEWFVNISANTDYGWEPMHQDFRSGLEELFNQEPAEHSHDREKNYIFDFRNKDFMFAYCQET